MARHLGVGSDLTPAGHPPVDQPFVASETDIRAKPEPFHHPGAKSFDEGVGIADEPEHGFDTGRRLEVDADRSSTAVKRADGGIVGEVVGHVGGAIDADHVGTHVGENHAAEGCGTDALQLDDGHT